MPTALEELSSISQILNAANHRNKNQHRLAKWWKAFSVLRRSLLKLVTELETLSANEERLGETKKTIASREVVERRVEFLVERIIPRCYLAFSTVVADNQYANLGLMLLGTLARVRKIIMPLRKKRDEEGHPKPAMKAGLIEDEELDLGEVVRRGGIGKFSTSTGREEEELQGDVEEVAGLKKSEKKKSVPSAEPNKSSVYDSTPTKSRKKKKRKGDEFDDLFGSLL